MLQLLRTESLFAWVVPAYLARAGEIRMRHLEGRMTIVGNAEREPKRGLKTQSELEEQAEPERSSISTSMGNESQVLPPELQRYNTGRRACLHPAA